MNAAHSGFLDALQSNYFGLYAVDQLDLTARWKLRLSGREDIWNTQLTPRIFVPGRIFQGTQLIEPPQVFTHNDHPFSWIVGSVYRLFPGVSPYFGVARSNLSNFMSESTQSGVHNPESGLQYEGGIKIATARNRIVVTAAGFEVKRNNVFTLVGDVPVFNDQQTYGFEANVQTRIAVGWTLNANTTTQRASLTDNPSSPTATGKQPVGVSQQIVNLWTSYGPRFAGFKGLNHGAVCYAYFRQGIQADFDKTRMLSTEDPRGCPNRSFRINSAASPGSSGNTHIGGRSGSTLPRADSETLVPADC